MKKFEGVTGDGDLPPNPMTADEYLDFNKARYFCIDEKLGGIEVASLKELIGPTGYMTKAEYYEFVEQTFAYMLVLIKCKNNDYTNGADDPFANFRTSETIGVPVLKGVGVRYLDKIQRVKSFLSSGNLEAESFEDALLDMIGYSMIMLGLRKEAERVK